MGEDYYVEKVLVYEKECWYALNDALERLTMR